MIVTYCVDSDVTSYIPFQRVSQDTIVTRCVVVGLSAIWTLPRFSGQLAKLNAHKMYRAACSLAAPDPEK